MTHPRVLVLGCTGLDKVPVLRRVRGVQVIDFERDYLRPRIRSWADYLFRDPPDQARIWNDAWSSLKLPGAAATGPVLLSLHGTLVRKIYGVSIGVNIERVCADFDPTLIVTLIDDVYSLWWRTEERAAGRHDRGRPTLEELLMARRTEAVVGDQIAANTTVRTGRTVRHLTLGLNHPIDSLGHLVFDSPRVVYLSFPISAPRELLGSQVEADRTEGGQLAATVNLIHNKAFALQARMGGKVIFVTPLAIDELPLLQCATQQPQGATHVPFAYGDRWQTAPWGITVLASPPPPVVPIPAEEIAAVAGIIRTDVGWRDYRLVQQADCLAVFDPVPPRPQGKVQSIARGVAAEIDVARFLHRPCVVFQDTAHDPSHVWQNWLGTPGSMGPSPAHIWLGSADSIDQLLESAATG